MTYTRLIELLQKSGEVFIGLDEENFGAILIMAGRAIERLREDNKMLTSMIERMSSPPKDGENSQVITCKECRHMQQAKVNKKGFLICPASGMEITDDDFCSYAEGCDPFGEVQCGSV